MTALTIEVPRLARRVRLLSWLSLAWMTVEGAVALLAGAAASSIALIGFGLDSAIEGFASLVIVWRFTGARMFSEHAERRAQQLVAIQFFLLAPYVAFESARALVGGEHADTSWVGIGLAVSSVILMPVLGIAKQRLADQLGSAATKGEGRQNMLCAYLAGALLLGLLGNALVGAWWLDPAVGLLIAGVAVKEGRDAWRGEGCCVSSPLDAACEDDCCRPAEPLQCSLDADGIHRQSDRYAALGRHATVGREPQRLTVHFDADVDTHLLETAIEEERTCCPFFAIELEARTAVFSVADPEHDPALDAIGDALRR